MSRSKSRSTRRSFVVGTCLTLCALAALMGVMVLMHGINDSTGRCYRICGMGFAIRQYFGQLAYERSVALMCFMTAAALLYVTYRHGRPTASADSRTRRKGRRKR